MDILKIGIPSHGMDRGRGGVTLKRVRMSSILSLAQMFVKCNFFVWHTLKFLISGYTRLLKSSILPRWDVCSEGPFINISKFADMGPLLGTFCQKDRLLICQYEVSIAPISSEKKYLH